MKLSTLIMIAIAIQLNILLFASGDAHEGTALFGFIYNPTGWSSSILFVYIGLIIAGATITGSFVGSFIYGKQDLMVFAALVGAIATCLVPVASLWQLIYEEHGLFGDASAWVASALTAPLLILTVFTLIGWWRSNSDM